MTVEIAVPDLLHGGGNLRPGIVGGGHDLGLGARLVGRKAAANRLEGEQTRGARTTKATKRAYILVAPSVTRPAVPGVVAKRGLAAPRIGRRGNGGMAKSKGWRPRARSL